MLIGSPVPEYLGGAAVKSPVFPNLEILDNLTLFNAADIRPALVRELTYLYVSTPNCCCGSSTPSTPGPGESRGRFNRSDSKDSRSRAARVLAQRTHESRERE